MSSTVFVMNITVSVLAVTDALGGTLVVTTVCFMASHCGPERRPEAADPLVAELLLTDPTAGVAGALLPCRALMKHSPSSAPVSSGLTV
ncbi:hypothetical protein D3C71_1197970 [compost metagenome]